MGLSMLITQTQQTFQQRPHDSGENNRAGAARWHQFQSKPSAKARSSILNSFLQVNVTPKDSGSIKNDALDKHFAKFLRKHGKPLNGYPQNEAVQLVRTKIESALNNSTGFVMGKVGGTEYGVLKCLYTNKHRGGGYELVSKKALTNSGIYPLIPPQLDKWNASYVAGLQSLNITVGWTDDNYGVLRKIFADNTPVKIADGTLKGSA
mmetsp:Transcript_7556/g.12558  ORF Transcript_7556/g.12558 Transcript_7556/m.12558 type:complete len:207 (-) Transcript_7556:7-627(-)